MRKVRLEAQPLTPQLIYKPATPGQRVDVIVRQFPAGGTLSSFDKVTLVLAKPLHGLVPHVVGLQPPRRARQARRAQAAARSRFGTGNRAASSRSSRSAASPRRRG